SSGFRRLCHAPRPRTAGHEYDPALAPLETVLSIESFGFSARCRHEINLAYPLLGELVAHELEQLSADASPLAFRGDAHLDQVEVVCRNPALDVTQKQA